MLNLPLTQYGKILRGFITDLRLSKRDEDDKHYEEDNGSWSNSTKDEGPGGETSYGIDRNKILIGHHMKPQSDHYIYTLFYSKSSCLIL